MPGIAIRVYNGNNWSFFLFSNDLFPLDAADPRMVSNFIRTVKPKSFFWVFLQQFSEKISEGLTVDHEERRGMRFDSGCYLLIASILNPEWRKTRNHLKY